jgi:polysaccharide biosynthesis transport protein
MNTELNLTGTATTPDSRERLIAEIDAIRWPNGDVKSGVPSTEKNRFALSNGAIRFASKLRAVLGDEQIIGFAGTSKRRDVSEISQQTALALARMDLGPVLLIDANLARPREHERFSVALQPGLAEVMQGEAAVFEAARKTQEPRLCVMPAGRTNVRAASLFSSASFRECLGTARQEFRFVIVEAPSMDEFVEASLVATSMDGLVLVSEAGTDTRSQLSALRSELASLRVKILGVLLHGQDA